MSQRPSDSIPSPNHTIPETTDPASVDLDEVLRPRTSRRRRAVQVGGVLAVLLVVVWALLRGVAPSLLRTASVAPSATPTPSTVVIASNVTFGVVTVNGRRLADPPPLVTTHMFHAGANVVTLTAPPFAPQSCSVLWSDSGQAGGGNGCVVNTGSTYHVNGVDVTPAFAVEFDLASTDLPSDLASSAYAVAAQAIAAVPLHTVVPSGQYYAAGLDNQGHIMARRAAATLQADVLVGPPNSQNGASACSAHMLCAATPEDPVIALPASHAGQDAWSVYTGLTLCWRYTSPSGIVAVSPSLPLNPSVQLALILVLTYDTSNRSWSVLAQPSSPFGGTGANLSTLSDQLVSNLCNVGSFLVVALSQDQTGVATDTPQNQSVAGCEIQLLSAVGATIQGTFLWRFGVLLAVDKGAHTLAPWLPLAPQAEIAAVGG